jgi:hypothetical protein
LESHEIFTLFKNFRPSKLLPRSFRFKGSSSNHNGLVTVMPKEPTLAELQWKRKLQAATGVSVSGHKTRPFKKHKRSESCLNGRYCQYTLF